MARKVTSPRAASKASKVLSNPNSSKSAKSAAASALSQRERQEVNSLTSCISPKTTTLAEGRINSAASFVVSPPILYREILVFSLQFLGSKRRVYLALKRPLQNET